MTRTLFLALLTLVSAAPAKPGATPLRALQAEAARQDEALVRAHFNLTRGFTLKNDGPGFQLELLFPDADERELNFWTDAQEGSAELRILAPDGKVLSVWTGRSGEVALTATLPPGAYQVRLETQGSGYRVASLGVKGTVAQPCAVDAARVLQIPATPSAGFRWPYLLYLPEKPNAGHLLVAPNNTGFLSEDVALLHASATCTVHEQAKLADALGTPVLVPLFPRPTATGDAEDLYLHALTRGALEAQRIDLKRVDLQLLAMVKDARARLAARGVEAKGKLLLTGFSASGSFVNRFAVLHPEAVLAVASASPGGWPLAPVAQLDGEPLPYPVGLSGLDGLIGSTPSVDALRQVRWLFLLGAQDDNDAVPHRDSFSAADQALIFRRFGKTPVRRWKKAEALYRSAGLNARFRLYPRTGHEVSDAMQADTLRFFQDALRR